MSKNELTLPHLPDSDPRPERIGPYRIREVLGEGGMGIVYLAEQTEPVRRRVALKLIKLGMDTREVIARFESERQALALMNHPHVAAVYDAGATDQGRPYFVMEYVPGESITAYCDKHQLSLPERLNLFIQVCHAIQHAHQKGIIHRDIKPSNVLVMYQDGAAVPKVIDFGVAKATDQRLTEKTIFTEQGRLIGTPAYMSPEQAEMTTFDIDTRTDVYSLGVLLYELLTGTLPFDPKSFLGAGFAAIRRIIREVEPSKPSIKLSSLDADPRPSGGGKPDLETQALGLSPPHSGSGFGSASDVAKRRRTDPKSLIHQIRGDLDWITMKALEKDRTRRYDSASDFAADIQRHLRHEPVVASPPSVGYRVSKFVRRNKGPVTAIAVVFLVLVVGVAVSTSLYIRAEHAREETAWERDRAIAAEAESEKRRAEAEAVTKFLSDMLASVKPEEKGKDVSVRQILDEASKTIGEKFDNQPLIEARLRSTIGQTYYSLGLYEAAEPHFISAAQINTRELGKRHRETLSAISNLASTLSRQGKTDEAEGPHRRTLEIHRRVLGEEHPDTLMSMNNLAVTLQGLGKSAEAEELHRRTLKIRRRVLGKEHPDTLLSMNNLANTLAAQGKYAQAEELFRKNLEILRRVLGEEHRDTLRSMSNLAAALAEQGELVEAEELGRKTLEIRRRVLGEEHPATLESMNNLALMLQDQGKFPQAEELHRKTLKVRRRVLGEEHPKTLRSMNNLGDTLLDQGNLSEAEELGRKMLAIRRRVLGNDHPDTLTSINFMGALLNSLGKHEDAFEMLHAGKSAARRVWTGQNIRWLGNYLAELGEAEGATNRFAESEATLLEAHRLLAEGFGANHARTTASIERLITVYESWHTVEPGEGYGAKAAEWRAKLPDQSAE